MVSSPGERGRIIPDLESLRLAYRPYAIAPGQGSIAARYPGIRWPLLQRYVPSARTRVYSISGIKDPDGGIVAASLSYKRHQWPPDTGISTSQVTCRDPSILRAGLATVDRLVSRGIFELELLDDDGHLLAIDLNPRAFGFIALDMAVGNDLPWLWYRSTLGPIGPPASGDAPPIMAARLALPALIGGCIGLLRRDGHRDTERSARRFPAGPVHIDAGAFGRSTADAHRSLAPIAPSGRPDPTIPAPERARRGASRCPTHGELTLRKTASTVRKCLSRFRRVLA